MDDLVNKVLDRLGINDGLYEFLMEDFNAAMRRKDITNYEPNKGKISLIKFLRCDTPFGKHYGLRETKECTESNFILIAYFTAQERDKLIENIKAFNLTPDNYILTKKEEN